MPAWRVIAGSAVVVALVVLAVAAWRDRAAPVAIVIAPLEAPALRVAVSGAVATPGVVTLAPGARLADAIDAAGGLTEAADPAALNLAGRVGDGEMVVIPRGAVAEATLPVQQMAAPALLDLNTATAAQLETLPGIGPVLAGRIVSYRDEHGPFATVDELAAVEGITPRRLDTLRPLVTVGHGG